MFAANRKLPVRRQRLVYRPGPHAIDPLADDETLGGAGVARDGSAELDVLLADLTAAEADELGRRVRPCWNSCLSHSVFLSIRFARAWARFWFLCRFVRPFD